MSSYLGQTGRLSPQAQLAERRQQEAACLPGSLSSQPLHRASYTVAFSAGAVPVRPCSPAPPSGKNGELLKEDGPGPLTSGNPPGPKPALNLGLSHHDTQKLSDLLYLALCRKVSPLGSDFTGPNNRKIFI